MWTENGFLRLFSIKKQLDFQLYCEYNGNDVFTVLLTRMTIKRRCIEYENDIPAEEEVQIQSSWVQSKNEDGGRKKGSRCKESKGKKGFNRIEPYRPQICGLFYKGL